MDLKPQTAAPAAPASATHARSGVVAFAITLALLSYADRVAIAAAAPLIARDLRLNTIELGSVLGIFPATYALCELPSGWLGDLIGPRKVLVRIVALWSACTALTGAMWSFWSMWTARFFFGAAEAGGFPNITRAMTTWLPGHERVRAQGWMWAGTRWGGAFAPLLMVGLLRYVNWRWAFVVFGLLGAVWTAWFYLWYRDDPATHPGVNAAELAQMPPPAQPKAAAQTPWRVMLSSRMVQLLCVQYFCLSFGWYFFITWFPTFLHQAYHLSLARTAGYAAWPLVINGFGSLFCGAIAPRLARWMGDVGRSRRWLAGLGMFGSAIFLALSAYMPAVGPVVLMMALAAFCNDWAVPTCWAACMDVGGEYAGTVSGLMNTAANVAAFIYTELTGFILHWSGGNWRLIILMMAGVYVPAALCWIWLDPVTPFATSRQPVSG